MNALAAAARRTLEEESARITVRSFWHPPLENGLTGSSGVGLVDFRHKRTYVRRSGWAGQVIRLLVERFPWLPPDDEEDPGDQDDPPIENIYADGESFWCVNDKWHRRDEETWAEADPIALLERLAACDEVHPRDGCFGFLIAEGRDRVYGDAWLDEEGRVDRVTYRWWSPHRRKQKAKSELWNRLELMDFGRPVAIEIPEIEEEPEPAFDPWGVVVDLGRVIRAAWHVFRRWRASRGPAPEEKGSGAERA